MAKLLNGRSWVVTLVADHGLRNVTLFSLKSKCWNIFLASHLPRDSIRVKSVEGDDGSFSMSSYHKSLLMSNEADYFIRIVNGCLGDTKDYLKYGKLEQVVAIIKSCDPNALGDLTVTLKDIPELHDGRNVTDEEHQLRLDEEALILAFEEEEAREARAEQEWLEKYRQEQETKKEHERQLWGLYV
ncbi:hypothetical protein Tco_0278056 [Tanacetum coccineum]